MLRNLNRLRSFGVQATDGEIGRVHDVYFDDHSWTIRYFVVKTGSWLHSRKVLISPSSIDHAQWPDQLLAVKLTREQVASSPDYDSEKPVSRQRELEIVQYFGWPAYWDAPYAGHVPMGITPVLGAQAQGVATESPSKYDPRLRSAHEVGGYRIHALDGNIGHVEDFLVEDSIWVIRYLVADTRNWRPGKWVLVSPTWVTDIRWEERRVHMDLAREVIKDAPEYDPSQLVARQYEEKLFEYYDKAKYWL